MPPTATSALQMLLRYVGEPPMIVTALVGLLVLALLGGLLLAQRYHGRVRRHAQAAAARCHSLAAKLSERRASEQTGEHQYWRHVRSSSAPIILTTSDREIVAASGPLL